MTVQYASDLHLEFPQNKAFLKQNPLVPSADVLLLAGDIVPFAILDKHDDFFSYLSDNFQFTYWVPGNHEYYHYDLSKKSGELFETIKSNVFLVNNKTIEIENVKFIFSTLWSKISPAHQWQIERSLSDFQVIKHNNLRLSAEVYNEQHSNCLNFIAKEIQLSNNCNSVVITHHVPTFLNYPESYKGDVLNEAFAIELFDLIERSNVNYWLYGHHHCNTSDFCIGKTNLITNQLGYVQRNEHHLFSTNKILSI